MENIKKIIIGLLLVTFTVDAKTNQREMVAPIVYVAGDGSGNFNCDGESDQVEINKALDFVASHPDYTTVYLKGSNTYWIDSSIYISSNTILEGDSTAIVKLVDNAGWWTQFKPLIGQKGTQFTFGIEDPSINSTNITIRGFEIDGNRDHQEEPSGHSYYTIIQLQNTYNITINDMYLHHNLADAIQTGFYKKHVNINSKFYNNRIHKNGHDAIFLGNVDNFEIFNNIMTNNRTDAGVRAEYCNHFKVHDNIIGNDPDRKASGSGAIVVEANGDTPVNDVEIYENYLYGNGDYYGIWLKQRKYAGTLQSQRDVHIHHNIISWYKKAGIGIAGFHNTLIENNIIELSKEDAGITFYRGDSVNNISGFKTIVINNIIVNNSTYGIDNPLPSIHTFISDNNDIYGNAKDDYNNASSSTDIHEEPLFAAYTNPYYEQYKNSTYFILSPHWRKADKDRNWRDDLGANKALLGYHLSSKYGRWNGSKWVKDTQNSPCIDKGNPLSRYTYEPKPNGKRINLGVFGNRPTTSKSNSN